jgi:adenine-specific DNA-methyltransferase
MRQGLQLELKDLTSRINQLDREARLAGDLQSKLTLQKDKAVLERQRRTKQGELFEAEDEIEARRNALLGDVEQRLQQTIELTELFIIQWEVV